MFQHCKSIAHSCLDCLVLHVVPDVKMKLILLVHNTLFNKRTTKISEYCTHKEGLICYAGLTSWYYMVKKMEVLNAFNSTLNMNPEV